MRKATAESLSKGYQTIQTTADAVGQILKHLHPQVAMDVCRVAYDRQRRRAKEKRYVQSNRD